MSRICNKCRGTGLLPGKKMNCIRCGSPDELQKGDGIKKSFIFHWAEVPIIIEGLFCRSCGEILYKKISKALFEDKA